MTASPAPMTQQEHADRIRAVVLALNDAVVAAARDNVAVTYDTKLGDYAGRLCPTLISVQVWAAL